MRGQMRVLLIGVLAVVTAVAVGCGGDDGGQARASTTATAAGATTVQPDPSQPGQSAQQDPSQIGQSGRPGQTGQTAASRSAALLGAVCDGDAKVTDAGTVSSPDITEASGIVASWNGSGDGASGPWWVHNDSGDRARLFAVDGTGRLLATVELEGAEARDWEDIAVGPPASPGGPAQLYVGDIGNNAAMRSPTGARRSIRIYRLDEPSTPRAPAAGASTAPVEHARATGFTLTYPDRAYDAEALLVDPIDGDLIVVTKDWSATGESQVFRASGAATIPGGSTTALEHVGSVPTGQATLVTAADVTRDGSVVALRSYGAVQLYSRPPGAPLWAAFEKAPCAGPRVSELQGESIGFAPDGGSYLTLAEGSTPTLHRTSP